MARRRAGWALAWLVATALVVVCLRQVEWSHVLRAVRGAHPGWLLVALLLNGTGLVQWALQWRLFLPRRLRPGFRPLFEVSAIMAMVANSVPFFAGQLTGMHLLAKRARAGRVAAVSVAALDQLAEGVAKLAVLGTVALLVPLPAALRHGLVLLVVGVSLLALGLLLASRRPELPGRLLRGRGAWADRIAEPVSRLGTNLEAMRRPAALAGGIALAFGMKAAEAGGIAAVQTAFGLDVSLGGTLLVLASVNLATMVSVAPGNLGVYEASAFAAYRFLGVDSATALGLAALQHLAYLSAAAVPGWIVVGAWRLGGSPSRARPSPSISEPRKAEARR